MHSVAKNKSDKISYGLYLTFIEAGNKLTHAVHKKRVSNIHAVEGHTERADRIRSYWQGTVKFLFYYFLLIFLFNTKNLLLYTPLLIFYYYILKIILNFI